MSETTSGVPEEPSNAGGSEPTTDAPRIADRVDLHVDEEKLEKWDEVKSDYEVNPDGKPMPNVWDAGENGNHDSPDGAEADAEQRRQVNNEDAPEVFAADADEESSEQ